MTEKNKNKWPIKITLKAPITVQRDEEEVEITELRLSKFKARHLKHVPIELDDAGFLVPLIAALTGIRKEEADELDIEDVMQISDKLVPFLEGLPGIGMK